jgi:hypothetical protein
MLWQRNLTQNHCVKTTRVTAVLQDEGPYEVMLMHEFTIRLVKKSMCTSLDEVKEGIRDFLDADVPAASFRLP